MNIVIDRLMRAGLENDYTETVLEQNYHGFCFTNFCKTGYWVCNKIAFLGLTINLQIIKNSPDSKANATLW